MIETNVKKEQQQLHSLLPLTLPSTNNPVDCLYERKGGRRPDEGLKETVRCNSDEMLKQVQHDGKGLAKDAQSQCPPLETLPNKNNPVDCFCERKPEFSIPRRGTKNYDGTRHEAAEPKNVKDLTSYRPNVLTTSKKAAFTLAEVLITLAVIGVVAALTLPGLIQNHNEKAWSTAKDLWEKKLTETVRRMNIDGVMTGHETTEDFMNSFKNYMKVIKTCDNTDINKCYSPKIVQTGSESEPEEIQTSELTTAENLGNDWGTNTMSFVIADGTTAIFAYNPNCAYADPIEDTGSQVSCLAYMVDVNGKKGPNRVTQDIALVGQIALSNCDNPIGDMCWSTDFAPTPLDTTLDENKQYDENSARTNNYWAGAKKACSDMEMSLPNRAQLAQLASNLYVDTNGNDITIGATENMHMGTIKVRDQYKDNPPFTINSRYWSSEDYSADYAYYRYFDSTDSGLSYFTKNISLHRALCISN